MTWLWTLLIVLGIAMIVVAAWPGLIGLGKKKPDGDQSQDSA